MIILWLIAILWIVSNSIRCLVFKKMELTPTMSLIPFYGTYLMMKKVGKASYFWFYIVSIFCIVLSNCGLEMDSFGNFVLGASGVMFFITWVSFLFYVCRYFKENIITFLLFVFVYPLGLGIVGIKKEKIEEEK